MLYTERQYVPLIWWVLMLGFAASLALAVGFYLGPVWAAAVTALFVATAVAGFWAAATRLLVTADEVRVGRAVLGAAYIAGCQPLDPVQTKARCGVDADARAHLMIRPYIKSSVEITLDDADDPVPYWLLSTRHPAALAAAVQQAAATSPRRD